MATNNTSTQASTQAGIQACMQATTQAIMQADEEVKKLLLFCEIPRIRSEMQVFMKISNKEHFRKNILSPLIKGGLVKLTISDKPTSPNQKYYCNKNY